ncbi:MAG: hypothetical protein Q9169_008031 [Polycauliona sp. 2 TL-2023]
MSAPSPALPPPSGQEPNFAHPDSLRPWIIAGLVTYDALLIALMHRHGGVHGWDLTELDVNEANYASILVFYRRIFLSQKGDYFDWVLRIFMVVLIIFYTSTTLAKIWACDPRDRIWDRQIPGRCLSISGLFNASGLFNWITDILMILIPVKALWKLQMTTRAKAGIAAVFTLGFCAPIFGIVGFAVRLKVSPSKDKTYYNTEISLWAAAEIAIGFVCVCVPELAALTRRRRHDRPSQSIVNGGTTSRRTGQYRLRRLGSLDEEAPWEGSQSKQRGHHEIRGDTPIPPAAVITKIQGGLDTPPDPLQRGMFFPQGTNGSKGADGIYRTVKMERSVAEVGDQ